MVLEKIESYEKRVYENLGTYEHQYFKKLMDMLKRKGHSLRMNFWTINWPKEFSQNEVLKEKGMKSSKFQTLPNSSYRNTGQRDWWGKNNKAYWVIYSLSFQCIF